MTREALAKPIGSPLLRDMVSGGKQVAVIVDDGTRPTPASEILTVLLPLLIEAGCPKEHITIVMALGTHVAMTQEELAAKLGAGVVSTYKVVHHNAWQGDLVPVRIPGDERTVIRQSRGGAVRRADRDQLDPAPSHGRLRGWPQAPDAGRLQHRFYHAPPYEECHPSSLEGGTAKGNPFHEDCMKIAQAIGLDVSIDCVYDREGRISRVIAGSLDAAFAEAVRLAPRYSATGSRRRWTFPLRRAIPIRTASSFTRDWPLQTPLRSQKAPSLSLPLWLRLCPMSLSRHSSR